jgi:signal transduction histidine kinase
MQRLMRRDDLAEPMLRELDSMAIEVHRMERLVREVLDFGRREALRRRRVAARDLLSAARNTVVALGETAEVGRLELRTTEPPVFLDVDPARVEQALVNLARNALQASPGGHVRAGWYQRGTQICFVVEDDGQGVPVEQRRRIFEPFFTSRREGTGLGLAIVAAVAHEHGGDVKVGSSDLGGACFELTLPLVGVPPETSVLDPPSKEVAVHAS